MTEGLVDYVLALGDDALVAAQRLSWWITRAPELEEDIALANIGLDLLGQARLLLSYAGHVENRGRDEDALAYFRDECEFRNVHLVEREQQDFGVAMARLLIWSVYQTELYSRLARSTDATLGAIAGKASKEVRYHADHATTWVTRLGDGTAESRRRMQHALDVEWRYAAELFDAAWVDERLVIAGIAVDPWLLAEPVTARVHDVVDRATLEMPHAESVVTGGRAGRHTEQMGYLLAEMQHLARSHPEAAW
jgi:ring-1,2-phenylacetyl-CoA epoxidase subunit PaaC